MIDVQSGQILSAVLTADDPSATMMLSLVGVVGPMFSVTPGQPVALPPELIPVSGPLTFRVFGDRTTTYQLDVYANAVQSSLSETRRMATNCRSTSRTRRLAPGVGVPSAKWPRFPRCRRSTRRTSILALAASCLITRRSARAMGCGTKLTGRQADGKPNHSPAGSLYFGRNEGPLGGGNYNTGTATAGTATSPIIALPAAKRGAADLESLFSRRTSARHDIAEIAM